jgi:hypothetical protein
VPRSHQFEFELHPRTYFIGRFGHIPSTIEVGAELFDWPDLGTPSLPETFPEELDALLDRVPEGEAIPPHPEGEQMLWGTERGDQGDSFIVWFDDGRIAGVSGMLYVPSLNVGFVRCVLGLAKRGGSVLVGTKRADVFLPTPQALMESIRAAVPADHLGDSLRLLSALDN